MGHPNWKNRTLWTGDNLDIMRGMNSESVDLIYLDPPFNSNRNYAAPIGNTKSVAAFKDTWSLDDVKKEWVEDIETDNTASWSAITAAGFTSGDSAQAYLTYMAIRLIEMRRILKPTGSLYLHCDPKMSHYIKLLMDAILGAEQYRNEIIWYYRGAGTPKADFARRHDVIFRYSGKRDRMFFDPDPARQPYADATVERFSHYIGNVRDGIDYGQQELNEMGKHPDDVITDIQPIAPSANARLYPTQKPLALLERIIATSSRKGDMVFDPFCGGGTTMVAAEALERRWAGADIEPTAPAFLVKILQQAADNSAFLRGHRLDDVEVRHETRAPKRTDEDAPQRSKNIKQVLYKRQNGRCAGPCGEDGAGRALDLDLFEVDHIVPRAKGGPDIDDNLQLLCPTCNRRKGSKTMRRFLELMAGND